jgi:hypothetical protein
LPEVYDTMIEEKFFGITENVPQNARRPLAIAGCRKRRARYVGRSGDLLPPSPPAEKATARQDQAGETGTDKGAVGGVVPTSVPAPIVERGLPGIVLALGWFARRHPVGSARPHTQASLLSRS